jgi:hypothetical protein
MTTGSKLSTCIILLLCACTRPGGYGNLDELHSDFVVILKSSDNARLREFCQKISPDKETAAFMRKAGFTHRGFPDKYDGGSIIVDTYYQLFYEFRERLKGRGLLDQLTYVRRIDGEMTLMATFNVSASETQIILKSGDETITCQLGEMLKISGAWKSFTKPDFH